MGVSISCKTPDGYEAFRIGTNGCQVIVSGYMFAAYAVAHQRESARVCAWVAPHWSGTRVPQHPDAPRPVRNQPKTVEALIAFSTDDDNDGVAESGYCFAQDQTIELGIKMKPATDPMLCDLVELWQIANTKSGIGVIPAELATKISRHLDETLLEHLATSEAWFETMCEIANVFRTASAHKAEVQIG